MAKDIASIEKVLNSRCSSDLDTGSKKRHWGTLINQFPPRFMIDRVLQCCKVPRFSDGKLVQWFSDGYLFTGFEQTNDPRLERILNIESGMQQEAVYLACTATGLGTCINNQGINGTVYGEKIATATYLIMDMVSPYKSGKFTTNAPGPEKAFIVGKNLREPLRDGNMECLSELPLLTLSNKTGSAAKKLDVSQLLWAAKGRTPHIIRLHAWKMMWGLTIPTWGGGQDYTSVYLVENNALFRYINWTKNFTLLNRFLREKLKWTRGNPTHETKFIRKININDQMSGCCTAIVLCQNEKTRRALWEVGYMLENMFLQARSLNIFYESKIFESKEILQLADQGIPNAVAALLL
jgi:hypothetical protein